MQTNTLSPQSMLIFLQCYSSVSHPLNILMLHIPASLQLRWPYRINEMFSTQSTLKHWAAMCSFMFFLTCLPSSKHRSKEKALEQHRWTQPWTIIKEIINTEVKNKYLEIVTAIWLCHKIKMQEWSCLWKYTDLRQKHFLFFILLNIFICTWTQGPANAR